MTNCLTTATGSNSDYCNRPPERLVLEGYRHWSAGYQTGSIKPWELAWEIYARALGSQDGRTAFAALSSFMRVLKKCASCPLRAFPFHSQHLCVEECLVVGLVAGIQHSDDVADLCLQHMTCATRCAEVEGAAHIFAKSLSALDQRLLPIPRHVIEDILARQIPQKYH